MGIIHHADYPSIALGASAKKDLAAMPADAQATYTVRYPSAVYVLHCFQKKSTIGIATPKPDLELIDARLRAVAALERG